MSHLTSFRKTLVVAAAVALALPLAAAEPWMAYGSYEPNTALDGPEHMWQEPPGVIKDRIYFDAYTTWGDAGANGAFINPNVGALRTNIDVTGTVAWEAVFGVWTDCNRDGYIGMAETAVREYASTLLLDDSICPATPRAGPNKWVPGANNYNGWVTELIPIANAAASKADSRIYKDDFALVWGDPGKPDAPVAPPGVQCQGRARGDAQSTGGLLWWLDCQGNGAGVGDQRAPSLIQTINDLDAATGLGFGVGSDPRESDSVLNQGTFGSDSSDNSAVYAQDCNAEPLVETGDLPGDDLDGVALVRPVPSQPLGDPSKATVPGTLNQTSESVYAPDGTWSEGSSSNCDFEDDRGQDFYGRLEGNVDVPPYNGKDAAWQNFRFQTASRGTLPANLVRSGSDGAPTDLGITALGIECGPSSCFESGWFGASTTWVTPVVATRAELDPEDPANSPVGADVAEAPYYTFYAYTARTDFAQPPGQGTYGGPQCGNHASGTHNGWNCDPAAWYRLSDGSEAPLPGGVGIRAKPGQAYVHRDVDCYDGSLGDTGLGASPSYYGPAPCER